jgi:prolipoprotein diacylglyceryltransferase
VIDEVNARGEYASLLVVAVLLWAAIGPAAQLLGLRTRAVGDLFWNGGLAFVVGGRLAYLALESPRTLIDPLVLIRIQGGIEPLAGAAGVALVVAWHARRHGAAWTWLTAGAVGLAVSTIGYDVGCVARDACFGAPAPAPFGFGMSGLTETRLATPLIEAAALLALLAAVLSVVRLTLSRSVGLIVIAGLALVRAALTPASALEGDAIGVETAVLVLAGVVALATALWLMLAGDRAPDAIPVSAIDAEIDADREPRGAGGPA